MDPRKFVAPYITPEQISEVVEELRREYPICREVPVDVLVFAEHDLKLNFDFKPIAEFGHDAILSHDFNEIVFDTEAFERNGNRLRFSVAHELGHLFLHKGIYGNVSFETVEEWISFIEAVPPDQYQWVERHADEFAGQLLMPFPKIKAALDETINDAEREGYFPQGQEAVLEFCCRAINRDFGVSRDAVRVRLRRSKLWPHAACSAMKQ